MKQKDSKIKLVKENVNVINTCNIICDKVNNRTE